VAADDLTPGIFAGVDSGGTRTNLRILEWKGGSAPPMSESHEVFDTLSGALRADLVPETLRRILAPLTMRADEASADPLPIYIWISAAGFTEWTRDRYLTALNDLAPDLFGERIKSVGIANDAVSLLLGLRADGVIIAGTGSNVVVRKPDGDLHQSGGHEWVACDYGSGFWIGLVAIRRAYRDLEAGTSSVLLQRIREFYGVSLGDDRALIHKLRDLAVGDENVKKEVARFAIAVCNASEHGDRTAQDIIRSEAEDLADVTAGALRRTIPRERLEAGVKMVQCGSLIDRTVYRSSFEERLEEQLQSGSEQKARLDWQRVTTGDEAAVRLAKDLAIDPERYLHLSEAFRPALIQW
jgi:N-acetylglucosamine kinase-like BadF-type ATPase